MKTTYPGLDYSRGISNADALTGIRYGVISQNSVMGDALDDIMTHGTDVAHAASLAEYLAEKRAEFAADSANDPDDFDEDSATDEFNDRYQSDNGLADYEYDREGYRLTGCLTNDLFVLKSPFYTFAQFCSPCVPGAGNLDSPFVPMGSFSPDELFCAAKNAGFPRVYCLGHDWFDKGLAPYAVFSAETGKQVFVE